MLDFKIIENKADAVIVGSSALYLQGLTKKIPNDIDIITTSIKGLPEGVVEYETDSGFSFSGKRAFYIVENRFKIDIFVEDKLPEYIEVNGLKIQTVVSMLKYYESILPRVKEYWLPEINNKIKLLSSWMEKI